MTSAARRAERGPGRLPILAVAVALAAAMACAHSQPDIATLASNSDQVIWEAGQKALEKHQWDSARQHFRRIIEGFPQSTYGAAARLAMGDTYFQEGGDANYILAINAYREFLTVYPSHPKSDYAQFQIADAYFRQRNGADRDQTSTQEALVEYGRLLDLYPNSPNTEKARERIVQCRQSLARAEFLAGYFYQRTRQACRAALARYEGILSEFPDYQQIDEVLYRLAECLIESGRGAEAQPHLARLLADYPQSEYAAAARELMSQNASHLPAGTPAAPQASPGPAGTDSSAPSGTSSVGPSSAGPTGNASDAPAPRPAPTPEDVPPPRRP